jgi:hypothetical protein
MRKRAIVIALGLAVVLTLQMPIGSAPLLRVRAADDHAWSTAYEFSGGTYYALSVTRYDNNFSPPAGSNCTTYYGGGSNPIYQTQWIFITSTASHWIELGTADQCSGFDYLFWGYGVAGNWYPVGQATTPGGSSPHTFRIESDAGHVWRWYVDDVSKGSFYWNQKGVELSVGLETYETLTVAPAHTYGGMRYKSVAGSSTWYYFAGRDDELTSRSYMCGHWASDSAWTAAENSTC